MHSLVRKRCRCQVTPGQFQSLELSTKPPASLRPLRWTRSSSAGQRKPPLPSQLFLPNPLRLQVGLKEKRVPSFFPLCSRDQQPEPSDHAELGLLEPEAASRCFQISF